MSSVDALAIWIFIEVHDVPRCSFIAAAHAEQRRGREIRSFPAFPGFGVASGDALKHLPRFFVTPLLIVRARDSIQSAGHVRIVRIIVDNRLPMFARGSERP